MEGRIDEHNTNKYLGSYTKRATDWSLFLSIECKDRNQAMKIERKIKSMKSVRYIENLEKHPEIIEKLKAL